VINLVIISNEWTDAPASGPMLPYQWMSDVQLTVTLQALRRVASGIKCKCLGAATQKSNAAPVSDAHEQGQIQGERVRAGEEPATASVRIAEFDFVGSVGDYLTQFFTLEKHAWVILWFLLSR
jgi:hypothetical protein